MDHGPTAGRQGKSNLLDLDLDISGSCFFRRFVHECVLCCTYAMLSAFVADCLRDWLSENRYQTSRWSRAVTPRRAGQRQKTNSKTFENVRKRSNYYFIQQNARPCLFGERRGEESVPRVGTTHDTNSKKFQQQPEPQTHVAVIIILPLRASAESISNFGQLDREIIHPLSIKKRRLGSD
jgi:hypothetical protein